MTVSCDYEYFGMLNFPHKSDNFVSKNLQSKCESFLKEVSLLNDIFAWLCICAYA